MSSDALVAAIGARLKRGRETAKHATVQPATTIAVAQVDDNGVTVTQPKDVEKGNKIFVQLANDQSRTVSVWNIGKIAVPNKEGIPVYVDRNPGGELQIVDADALLMDSAFDQAANSELLPELIDELIRWIMPGRNFKPLRARQAAEYGGLNVVIEDGIFQFNNASYAWLDKTPIDLSTVTVSASMKRPVLVGIDPATAESAILEGDEISTALPDFTLADYNTLINANLDKLWLAGYQRRDGITTFQSLYDLTDLRAWLSPGGAGIASGGFFMPVNLDFTLNIPANRQVPVKRLNIIDGGILNVDGILDLI